MTTILQNVENNPHESRYELVENGHMAYAAYKVRDHQLFINYVEADPPLRGTGAAGRLLEGVVAHAKNDGRRIVPVCGYAVSWFRRHPEHKHLLD
jgi:predicted GNAT family acetyltransferase